MTAALLWPTLLLRLWLEKTSSSPRSHKRGPWLSVGLERAGMLDASALGLCCDAELPSDPGWQDRCPGEALQDERLLLEQRSDSRPAVPSRGDAQKGSWS